MNISRSIFRLNCLSLLLVLLLILLTNNTSDSFRSSRVSETIAGYMLDYFFNV
jgi:hypothetical protein